MFDKLSNWLSKFIPTVTVPLLRWWASFCSLTAIYTGMYFLGVWQYLWDADWSKISFGVVILFTMVVLQLGRWTAKLHGPIRVTPLEAARKLAPYEWLASVMERAGLAGTVVGFIYMFSFAFVGIDPNDVSTIKTGIEIITVGMSTALLTTLVGIICATLTHGLLENAQYGLK